MPLYYKAYNCDIPDVSTISNTLNKKVYSN